MWRVFSPLIMSINCFANTKIQSNKTFKFVYDVASLVHTWNIFKLNLIQLQSQQTKESDMSLIGLK